MHDFACDLCVVGGGPAGLAAAITAARHRRKVVLVDDEPTPGGRIWRRDHGAIPPRARRMIADAARAGVRNLSGARVVDAASQKELFATTPDGPARIRCERLVLALGASELFLPFPVWTLPGVCGVGGLQALCKGGLDVRGKRIAIAGSGPLLLAVAAALRGKGAVVVGIHEQAEAADVRRFGRGLVRHPRKLAQALALLARLRGVPRHHASWPLRAEGDDRVRRVVMRGATEEIVHEIDWLACGFGLVPNLDVAALLGCAIDDEHVVVDGFGRTSLRGVFAAGEIAGIGGVDCAIAEGVTVGHAACDEHHAARRAERRAARERRFARVLEQTFVLRPEVSALATDDTLACRCEDVALGRARACVDLREAKLLTRAGMGPCQGRVCGPALRHLCGWRRDRVRPPLLPITFDEVRALGSPGATQEKPR